MRANSAYQKKPCENSQGHSPFNPNRVSGVRRVSRRELTEHILHGRLDCLKLLDQPEAKTVPTHLAVNCHASQPTEATAGRVLPCLPCPSVYKKFSLPLPLLLSVASVCSVANPPPVPLARSGLAFFHLWFAIPIGFACSARVWQNARTGSLTWLGSLALGSISP